MKYFKLAVFNLGFLFYALSLTAQNSWIEGYEYWFNYDYNTKTSVLIGGAAQSVSIQDEFFVNHTPNGWINTLHFRTWDNHGRYSVVLSEYFVYKKTNLSSGAFEIEQLEYWFDNQTQINTVQFGAANVVNVSEMLNTQGLKEGVHYLNIRFVDQSNTKSVVLTHPVMVSPVQQDANNEMVAYRYWFNNDFNQAVTNSFNPTASTVLLQDLKSVAHLPSDFYTFNFQFQDKLGNWGVVTTDTIFKNPLPIADFAADITQFCAGLSNMVQFSNLSIDGNAYLWDFGDGNTSVLENPLHTYTAAGTYNVSLQVIDSVSGLDSTFIWPNLIEIFDFASNTITINGNDSICDGQTTELMAETNFDYLWNTGQTTQSIVADSTSAYWVTITNPDFSACVTHSDTVMINVFALPNPQLTVLPSDTICDGEVVQISADSNYIYAWNTNATTQEITVNSAGTYWAELFNPDYTACAIQTDTVSITVKPLPIAAFDLAQNDYDVDFTDQSQFADSHWWDFGDGNTSVLTSPSHTYASAAVFEAILVVENSCGTDTAFQIIDLTYLSLEEMTAKFQLSVHPNPSNGLFYLTVDQERLQQKFTLIDSQGRIVRNGVLQDLVTQLDLTAQQSGVYMLIIEDKIFRLVKN